MPGIIYFVIEWLDLKLTVKICILGYNKYRQPEKVVKRNDWRFMFLEYEMSPVRLNQFSFKTSLLINV